MFTFRSVKVKQVYLFSEGEPSVFVFRNVKVSVFRSIKINKVCLFSEASR